MRLMTSHCPLRMRLRVSIRLRLRVLVRTHIRWRLRILLRVHIRLRLRIRLRMRNSQKSNFMKICPVVFVLLHS
jgi:hypothetical protein